MRNFFSDYNGTKQLKKNERERERERDSCEEGGGVVNFVPSVTEN